LFFQNIQGGVTSHKKILFIVIHTRTYRHIYYYPIYDLFKLIQITSFYTITLN
jgi:hypothetical protein